VTEPLLPDTTSDERQIGWGDDLDSAEDEGRGDERYEEDRPPHHDRD
jgi:hypothetical protein